MKKLLLTMVAFTTYFFATAQFASPGVKGNPDYSKAAALQAIMDSYTTKDLPGISVAVYTAAEGWWAGASGYSKTENKTPMNTMHLQYIQSVSKTYMAVAILQLYEQGKIKLDAPITTYLPAQYAGWIKNASAVTVRMLLNHTSGIAEYVSDPEYTATVLLTPTKVSDMHQVMQFLANEEPRFAPGTKYTYTNTNYTLLALIADAVTGDHAKFIDDHIFKPLGLTNTYYRDDKNYLHYPNLVDTYWDLLNTGRPVNISPMQQANVASLIGDDGIVCTPVDVLKFMKGLMEGKLLKATSLAFLQEWVSNDEGYPIYGLGLSHIKVGELDGCGHGGGGIGAGCILLYIPEKQTYIFVATNIGVIWDGLPAAKANEMKDAIWKAALQ